MVPGGFRAIREVSGALHTPESVESLRRGESSFRGAQRVSGGLRVFLGGPRMFQRGSLGSQARIGGLMDVSGGFHVASGAL